LDPAAVEGGESPDDLVGGDTGRAHGSIHDLRMAVQPGYRRPEGLEPLLRSLRRRAPEGERPRGFFEYGLPVRLVAVQLEANRAQPESLEAAMDDVERRHLLGDEEDLLPLLDRRGDQVRDRLRLTRSRWPLDDEVTTPPDLLDDDRLGAVRVR